MSGSTYSICPIFANPLRMSQIDQSNPSTLVDHKIRSFNIAVDETIAMNFP
jgi:hypothetical protein